MNDSEPTFVYPLVTRFTLRPEDDRLTVGPQRAVREGVVRVTMGDVQENFIFTNERVLHTSRGSYGQPEDRVNHEFEIPWNELALKGVRIFYNMEGGWLRVERMHTRQNLPIEVHVDFPGDKALRSLCYSRSY